jgi:TonB family protein
MKLRFCLLFSALIHAAFTLLFSAWDQPPRDLTQVQMLEATVSAGQPQAGHKKSSPPTKAKTKVASAPTSQEKSESTASPSQATTGVNKDQDSQEPVAVSDLTEMPRVIKDRQIPFTSSARRAGIDGVVDLIVVVGTTGQVLDAIVKRGPGYGLDEAALNAIKEFVFSPAKIGNQPVKARIPYKIVFNRGGSQ